MNKKARHVRLALLRERLAALEAKRQERVFEPKRVPGPVRPRPTESQRLVYIRLYLERLERGERFEYGAKIQGIWVETIKRWMKQRGILAPVCSVCQKSIAPKKENLYKPRLEEEPKHADEAVYDDAASQHPRRIEDDSLSPPPPNGGAVP